MWHRARKFAGGGAARGASALASGASGVSSGQGDIARKRNAAKSVRCTLACSRVARP